MSGRVAQLEIVLVIASPWAKQHHLCGVWFNQEALHRYAKSRVNRSLTAFIQNGLFHASVIDFVAHCVQSLVPSYLWLSGHLHGWIRL